MARTRVRTGRVVGLVGAVAAAVLVVAGAASGSVEAPAAPGSETHLVAEGDTLWGIARGLVGPEGDPRPVVHDLRELNDLRPGSVLLPGVTLVLPGD